MHNKGKMLLLCSSFALLVMWGQACTLLRSSGPAGQSGLASTPGPTFNPLPTAAASASTFTDASRTPQFLVTPIATSLTTHPPSTGTLAPVATGPLAAEPLPSTLVPVNQRVGWIVFSARDGSRDLALLSPEEGTIIKMGLSSLRNLTSPTWSFDWQKIAFVADSAYGHGIYVVDAGCVDLTEGCRPYARNLTEDEPGFYGYPAWSPDGRKIAYSFRASSDSASLFQIWVMNADGSNKTRLTSIGGSDPDWSPDGQMIAFGSEHMATSAWGNVFIMQADGSNPRQLTKAVPDSSAPAWAPDGQKIAFVSTEGQDLTADNAFTQIYTVEIDGSDLKKITGEKSHGNWPSWSPDGGRLVFEHSLGGLWMVKSNGSNATRLSGTEGGRMPTWQP